MPLPHFVPPTLVALLLCASFPAGAQTAQPRSASDLFKTPAVWNVHLKFTADQWTKMEPAGSPGSGRGMGGPPSAATFMMPAFLKADSNADGKVSREEFAALGETWFSKWDTEKRGALSTDQMRNGLNAAFPLPGGGPGGMPGGPGANPMGGFVARQGARNGLSGMSGVDFQYVSADLDFEGRSFKNVAVRYKGNSTFMMSRNSDKRPMKVDLNKYVKGQKLAGISEFNLQNNVMDASWMNEVIAYGLFREAAVPSPRTAYARVYLTVDGKFRDKFVGLYTLVEDVDKTFAEDRFKGVKGAIFKPSTRKLFEHIGDDWSKYQQAYDPKTDLTEGEQQRVIEFAKFVSSASDPDFNAGLGKYLDLEEFARFMAVSVWLSNLDSVLAMGQNYYVYLHPKTNKFQFIPWDLDHSFGQFPMTGSQEQRERLSLDQPWVGENRFLERVFQVAAFKKLYTERLAEFQKKFLRPEAIIKQVDELAAVIRPVVKEESEQKLARFDKAVAGEAVGFEGFGPGLGMGGPPGGGAGPRGGAPGMPPMAPAKPIKAFVPARASSVADQLAGKSKGEVLGMGGPPRGGPGGRGGFGPAMFLQPAFVRAMDTNKDGSVTRSEFEGAFAAWFAAWNSDKTGALTEEQLRAGIARDFAAGPGPGGSGPRF